MTQRIRLVDIDSIIPNLALMQISAYHKTIGDTVGFDIEDPDIIYVSCIFDKNASQARGIQSLYPNAEIILGGSGFFDKNNPTNPDFQRKIPLPAQKIKPDYTLYPKMDYDLGFTTRGCFRSCPFCIVRAKEGSIKKWQHISEFHDPKHKTVHLLDNNIYAAHDWFFENTDYVLENNLKLRVLPGFDIRILTEEIADRLKQIRWDGMLNFAWDCIGDEKSVLRGIEILKQFGFDLKHKVGFYVLVEFDSTHEQDLYRCRKLKEAGVNAFVMQYKESSFSRHLARWANKRELFWSIDFSEYSRAKRLPEVNAE